MASLPNTIAAKWTSTSRQQTFHGFMALTKWGSLALAAALVFLVIWFCTKAGFLGGGHRRHRPAGDRRLGAARKERRLRATRAAPRPLGLSRKVASCAGEPRSFDEHK